MSSSQFALLRVPFQVIEIDLIIEKDHPLRIPYELLNEQKLEYNSSQESPSTSITRLNTTFNRIKALPDSLTLEISVGIKVVRDLILGHFWSLGELRNETNENYITSNVEITPRIDYLHLDAERLTEIIEPAIGYLSRHSELSKGEIPQHTRIEKCNIKDKEFAATEIRQVSSTDGRKQWIYNSGPFGSLIAKVIDSLPGFEPTLPEIEEIQSDYPFSPEVQALRTLRKLKSKSQIDYAIQVCKSLASKIKEETHPRLNHIQVLAGSAGDMWEAAVQVLKTSHHSALILSSFTNHRSFKNVVQQIREVSGDSTLQNLFISIGEPDRISGQAYLIQTNDYLEKLHQDLSNDIQLKSGISKLPNHVKCVISDSGWTLLTSSNLLSSNTDQFVLESGALIQDLSFSKKLLEVFKTESWLPESNLFDLDDILSKLSETQSFTYNTSIIEEKLNKTLHGLEHRNSRKRIFALVALENQLQKIAEHPQYQLIINQAHRNLLVDSINRFDERLVLASDGLRESGLDLAQINAIKSKAKSIRKTGAKKPIVQVWWGRHSPGYQPSNPDDIRGFTQAKSRLSLLRKSNNYTFHPHQSDEPMESHSKLILLDDCRLILTSDNFLAYGDPEFYTGESGELGILLDHPRLTRQHRGQMELWLPTARDNQDLTRWGAALADEINNYSLTQHSTLPLEEPLIELLHRVLELPALRLDWNATFNNTSNQVTIQQIIDSSWNNGGIISLFHASGSGSGNFKSITIEQTMTSLSGDPIWKDLSKDEEDFILIKKKQQEQVLIQRVNQTILTPEAFSMALKHEMKKPYEWAAFTGIYGNVIQKHYLFNLKFRKIKPTDYLEQCLDYLEIDIRRGHHWIRMRRQ